MPTERCAGKVEVRIENILPMFPGRQPVVDYEREHYGARGRFAVGNVFAPSAAACSITADARQSIARIAPCMPESSGRLIGTMVRGRAAHSRRERQRRLRLSASQKGNRLVQSPHAFLCPDSRMSRQDHDVAAHPAAQFFHESGIKRRVSSREIQLTNHRTR